MAFTHLVGIDEVGRGPIAGPLCVGGCALRRERAADFYRRTKGLRDSKQLTALCREHWAAILRACAEQGTIRLACSFVGEKSIDAHGLSDALRSATERVLSSLALVPESSFIMLDGLLRAPHVYAYQESVIDGDENEPLIAAASIIAKVERDRLMAERAKQYPAYGFDKHKGYGTRAHYLALEAHGPCELHRKSFLRRFKQRARSGDFDRQQLDV